jgi:hypothetical protein
VDRGKPGSKIHVLSERGGLPITVAVSAANTRDPLALTPLVMAIPAVKSRRGLRHQPEQEFSSLADAISSGRIDPQPDRSSH